MRRLFGLLLRWAILAAAVAVAAWLLPGISVIGDNGVVVVIIMAGVLGLLNAFVRPVLVMLSCGCIALTLGLFVFVINAAVFYAASWISENWLGAEFVVRDFWWALAGSIITGLVSWVIELILGRADVRVD
jgi:putative membrane protein